MGLSQLLVDCSFLFLFLNSKDVFEDFPEFQGMGSLSLGDGVSEETEDYPISAKEYQVILTNTKLHSLTQIYQTAISKMERKKKHPCLAPIPPLST